MPTIPPSVYPFISVLIYGGSLFVAGYILIWNWRAVRRLQSVSWMHWFPSFAMLAIAFASLYYSFNGTYASNLDALPSPLGIGIGLPILSLLAYALWSKTFRDLVRVSTLAELVFPQVTRVSGLAILLLATSGALAPHVGYAIGVGDILTALLAIVVLLALRTSVPSRWIFWWNTFGLADFILAATLTVLTLPTAIQVFHTVPDSSVLAVVPVGIAPTFYVPLLYLMHFAVYRKLKSLNRLPS